jgi:hypothetical protein
MDFKVMDVENHLNYIHDVMLIGVWDNYIIRNDRNVYIRRNVDWNVMIRLVFGLLSKNSKNTESKRVDDDVNDNFNCAMQERERDSERERE